MKRIEYFKRIMDLFRFKVVSDENGNEYVLFDQSKYRSILGITDKTEFEAVENHVHLLDNIKKEEFELLTPIAKSLGQILLDRLEFQYPTKKFVVYVSIKLRDSLIIRFHQKWDGEPFYYDSSAFQSTTEKVFQFES